MSPRVSKKMISVFGSRAGRGELEEVRESLSRQWLGMGPKVAEFEGRFAARLGLEGVVLVNRGSSALQLAVSLLNLPPGSEVILPSFTWVACAHAVRLAGCTPVFCDVDIDTHNVTASTIAKRLTRRSRAVMVVHYAGLPVRMKEILALGLPVIEDVAHAVDSRIGEKSCGSFGDVGIYSFDAVKNLAMGEGGALTARREELIDRARKLRYCGIGKSGFESSVDRPRWWEHPITAVFPKMLPTDISAGIGLGQLRSLNRLQKRRAAIWKTYQAEFLARPWLICPKDAPQGEQHSFFTYLIRVPGGRRDALARHLYDRGIYTTLRYQPLHLTGFYGSRHSLPNAERLSEEGLNLPLHPGLSESDVDRILDAIAVFERRGLR